jgi:hypothetical protein
MIIEMKEEGGYAFTGEIEAESVRRGYLDYRITVEFNNDKLTYPAGAEGAPGDWDYCAGESWKTRVVTREAPILLFDAQKHSDMITRSGRFVRFNLVPSRDPTGSVLEMRAGNLDNQEHDYSLRYCFRKNIAGRTGDLAGKKGLYISGRSLEETPLKIQVALVMTDGSAYGEVIEFTEVQQDHMLSLDSLRSVKLVLLPKAYPDMMPYWFDYPDPLPFNISEIESVQVSIGPGIPESDYGNPHNFALERIWLE